MFKAQKTVYIVRHGQSEDNAKPVFQSTLSPLSKNGLQQASQIAERVKHINFDALISSPLPRAKQTADKIAKSTGKIVEESELFVERIKPTLINGKPWTDKKAAEIFRRWDESLTSVNQKVEDGENFQKIVKRADQALDYLLKHDSSDIVVVSHGHFIRTLIAIIIIGNKLDGETAKRFYDLTSLENTGISVIQYREAYEEEARWRVWTLNDHAHFAE